MVTASVQRNRHDISRRRTGQSHLAWRTAGCLALAIHAGNAAGFDYGESRDNPIIAGMRAMMSAMGFKEDHSPFPDTDPFDSMPWGNGFGMSPWSAMGPMAGFGSMPGLGSFPGPGSIPGIPSFSPWSWAMPGGGSPWDYARPERWSREGSQYLGPEMSRFRKSDPDSPTRELDGLWVNQNGDRLWFRNGWVRITRNQHQDARAMLRSSYLYIGIPETKEVLQYEYGVRHGHLGLRDADGNVQMFRRYR